MIPLSNVCATRNLPGRLIFRALAAAALLTLYVSGLQAQKLSFGERPPNFDGVQAPTHKSAALLEPLDVVYPDSAVDARMQGIALVATYIDEKGIVSYGEVEKSSGYPLLDRAALDAVRQGNFKAAWRDNHPVGSRISIPVEFRLPDSEDWNVDKSEGELKEDVEHLRQSKKNIQDEAAKLEEELKRLKAQQDSLKRQVKRK